MEDDGLFDRSHMEDEPFDALPPPLSPGQDQGDPFGDSENGEMSKLADVPEAKRKGVKRPQPKLDSNRLISDRGLPALRTLFTNVQFKGRGHEAEDLRLLMKRMENWAHRLFPKLQFEDFIDKVERLGAKKEVQTCLKRIRLDMPLTHEDYTSQEGEEHVPNDVQIFGDPDPFGGEHLSTSPPRLVHSTPAPGGSAAHSLDPSLGSSPTPAPWLSEEQRRRMEENRLKALERRLAKQKQLQEESQSVEPQNGEPEPPEPQNGEPEPQTGNPKPQEPQTGNPKPPESQTREPELVPMEESTEVTSELSPSQVQDHEVLNPVSSSMTPNQPPNEDSETHVEPTPEPVKPEASPSPVPKPEESREDEK